MRKTVSVFITLLFCGGLMVWTGLANLALLQRSYPDPQFVFFGLLCLEGGVVFWTALFLLHEHGTHKGMAVVMIGIDVIFSLTGFFLEISHVSGSTTFLSVIPAIPVILAADVAINIVLGIIIHLLPDGRNITRDDFRPLLEAGASARNRVKELAASRNGAKEAKE